MAAKQPENRRKTGRKPNGQFAPGVCPNPGGRPKSRVLSKAGGEYLAAPSDEDPSRSNAEMIVEAIGQQAKAGDLQSATWLADRTEGRPSVSFQGNLDIADSRNDDKLRETALECYRDFLAALNGDEARARELMNEHAPTLSRYIN